MTYEISSLDQLSTSEVQALLTQISTELQENNSTLDLKRGVFHDVVLYYQSVLEAAVRENLNRYLASRSLQQIEKDPTLADDNTVNDVLSNWGITRKVGTQATGEVSIVVSSSTSVTIPSGAIFEAQGQQFTANTSYTSTTNATAVTTPNDRLMTKLSDGNYLFTIFVTAVDAGSDAKIDTDSLIVPNAPIPNYVSSYATSDFADGTNTETNTELVNQLQDGIAAKALSNRVNMRSLLRSLSGYESVTNQSIVGYGDAEMLRDQHSLFPISYGGRVDWYIRGQSSISTVGQTKEAVLISTNDDGHGTWQFSVLKGDAPGFYEVTRILVEGDDPSENESFSVTSDVRGLDLTGTGFIPDIVTQKEGAFSAFQTATIQFLDTKTDASSLALGAKQNYDVEFSTTPYVSQLQSYMGSRDVRSYGSDVLVKAPIPCFVQVTLTVNKSTADADPDVDAMKNAIVSAVNSTAFIGRLDASRLLESVSGFIQNNLSITDVDLFGRILTPNYASKYLRDADSLVVVDDAPNMVTAKTVQFFTTATDVSINVKTSIPVFS